MYSEIVRPAKSGFLQHLGGRLYAEIGESTQEIEAWECADRRKTGKNWQKPTLSLCGIAAFGLLVLSLNRNTAYIAAILVFCAVAYQGNLPRKAIDGIQDGLSTCILREIDRFDRLQTRISRNFHEIRQLEAWVSFTPSRIEQSRSESAAEIDGLKRDLQEITSSLLPSPFSSARLHQIQLIRLYAAAALRNRRGNLWGNIRFWSKLSGRCTKLQAICSELESGIELAIGLLANTEEFPIDSTSFECGELRKVHSFAARLIVCSRKLYEKVTEKRWEECPLLFNDLCAATEEVEGQLQVAGQHLSRLISGARYSLRKDRLVLASEVSMEPQPQVEISPAETAVPTMEIEENTEDDSETAYVFEGISQKAQIAESAAPSDTRTYRLSQRTLAELKEKIKSRPQAKVKMVRVEDFPPSEVACDPPVPRPEPTPSPSKHAATRKLLAEMMSSRAIPRSADILEG